MIKGTQHSTTQPKLEKRKQKYTSEHSQKKNEKYTRNAQNLNCERCGHDNVEQYQGVGSQRRRGNAGDRMGASNSAMGGRNDIRLKSE